MSHLRALFKNKLFEEIKQELALPNVHLVPKLEKVVVNLGIGSASRDDNLIQQIKSDVFRICGQKPIEIKAKKSVAGFKVREGVVCALKVTLRGNMMYDFLERFLKLALPQWENFDGYSVKSFQGEKVFSIGVPDCSIFPEMPFREKILCMGINVVTNSSSKAACKRLLEKLGFPFRD